MTNDWLRRTQTQKNLSDLRFEGPSLVTTGASLKTCKALTPLRRIGHLAGMLSRISLLIFALAASAGTFVASAFVSPLVWAFAVGSTGAVFCGHVENDRVLFVFYDLSSLFSLSLSVKRFLATNSQYESRKPFNGLRITGLQEGVDAGMNST